jgi:3'(2'), 5'-bisphosphate nucleotidase
MDLAQLAGAEIRAVQRSGKLDVKQKGPKGVDDPFTQADINSQNLIVGGLLTRWSGLKVVGEENLAQVKSDYVPKQNLVPAEKVPENLRSVPIDDVAIFIDPLDATKEFTIGKYECVMTLIGISLQGVPVAGVMYQPFVEEGKLYWGMVGLGVEGIVRKPAPEKTVLTVTASHPTPETQAAIDAIKPDRLIRTGGAGYKILLVLEGQAHVYVIPQKGTSRWDTCGPEALLRAVGGSCTDIHGDPYTYVAGGPTSNDKGVVASLADHQRFIDAIKSAKL